MRVGILAYGSLSSDSGAEIEPLIRERIAAATPFTVEYCRRSRKRGGGPAVVPHPLGGSVSAVVLVLDEAVNLEIARNLLWRRETGRVGSAKRCRGGGSGNAVLVTEESALCGGDHVLHTDFNESGKIQIPEADALTCSAIESVRRAEAGKDGITYLIERRKESVLTPLTEAYVAALLQLTGASTLEEAK